MFIFRQKKIIFDAFITDGVIADMFPISKATKHYPDFWKALQNSYSENESLQQFPTMKGCAGLNDYYAKGFILPLWSDLAIKTEKNSMNWQFADGKSNADSHNYKQRVGFLPNYYHLKLNNPWIIKGSEEIGWVNTQPNWNFSENLIKILIPPAITEFKYQHATAINTFIPIKEEAENYFLEAGQPLLHFTPITDKKVDIKIQVIGKEEYLKLIEKQNNYTFLNKYRNYKKFAKKNKCPFSN